MYAHILILGLVSTTNAYQPPPPEFIEWNNLTSSDKEFVIGLYNDYRTAIYNGSVTGYPKGMNFKQMVWDDELEQQAAMIVQTCDTVKWWLNHTHSCGSPDESKCGLEVSLTYRSDNVNGREAMDRALSWWYLTKDYYKFGTGTFPSECTYPSGNSWGKNKKRKDFK